MIDFTFEILSPKEILLGFKISVNYTGYLEAYGPASFSQIEVGLIFFYIKLTKYTLLKEKEED